jgi:hypothetical protein
LTKYSLIERFHARRAHPGAQHGILGVECSDRRNIAGVVGVLPGNADGLDCRFVRSRICRRRISDTGRQRSEARR